MREFEGFNIQTVAENPGLAGQIQDLIDRVWPRFVTEGDAPKGHPLPFDWLGSTNAGPICNLC